MGLYLRRIIRSFAVDCRLEKHRAIEGLFHNRIFLSKKISGHIPQSEKLLGRPSSEILRGQTSNCSSAYRPGTAYYGCFKCSVFSAASGQKNGRFNRKRN